MCHIHRQRRRDGGEMTRRNLEPCRELPFFLRGPWKVVLLSCTNSREKDGTHREEQEGILRIYESEFFMFVCMLYRWHENLSFATLFPPSILIKTLLLARSQSWQIYVYNLFEIRLRKAKGRKLLGEKEESSIRTQWMMGERRVRQRKKVIQTFSVCFSFDSNFFCFFSCHSCSDWRVYSGCEESQRVEGWVIFFRNFIHSFKHSSFRSFMLESH